MKRILMLSAVLSMLFTGIFSAFAEDEVPPPESTPMVSYKNGILIHANDDFELKFNGRFQPRFYYEKVAGQKSTASASIKRARIDFKAMIAKKLTFHLALQHGTKNAKFQTVNIIVAAASYEFNPSFVLTVGTVGMPLSIIGSTSSAGYFLLEPPIVLTQTDGGSITPMRSDFGNPDGLGLSASGDIGKFFYELSVVNGAARTVPTTATAAGTGGVETNYDLNLDSKASVGARVGWNILEAAADGVEPDLEYSEKAKWTVNMGGMYQGKRQDPDSLVLVRRILTGSVGTAFKWRGFSVLTEAFGRKTRLISPGTATWFSMNMDDFGYYVDSGYFIVPKKFEVAGTVSQIFREGQANNSYQLGGGLNYYIMGNNLKLQLGYTMTVNYQDKTGSKSGRTHLLGTQLTASF